MRRAEDALLAELKGRLLEISDLSGAAAVLSWDQSTYMPAGGAPARGRQGALINRLTHERRTDAALGRLIDQLVSYGASLPPDSDDAALIRVTARDFAKSIRVPADFVERLSAHASATYDAWTRARQDDDFASMRPLLERTLDLSCEYAEFFAPYQHVIDPFIDDMDEGMTCAAVRALFAQLRAELVPLVRAVCDRPPADDRCLHGAFAEAPQLDFCLALATAYGYDLKRGRLDRTPHPFCTRFSGGDVRITTRVYPDDVTQALFSTLHEAGHGMYEQGVAAALDGTPLGSGTSAGVHESQSRLWENVVGRSRGLWQHYYPKLQATFPEQLGQRAARHLLSRHQQGRALVDPHRGRRGDLQPPHHPALRSRGRDAGAPAGGQGSARGLAGALPVRSGNYPAGRPGRLPAGRALVRRLHRRRLPQLHHRQCAERPVLRRRRCAPIRRSRRRSAPAGSQPSRAGSTRISIATAASTKPTRSCAAPPASR